MYNCGVDHQSLTMEGEDVRIPTHIPGTYTFTYKCWGSPSYIQTSVTVNVVDCSTLATEITGDLTNPSQSFEIREG